MPVAPEFLEPWYTALRSSAGICLRILQGTREQYVQRLYKARAEAMDPGLKTLSIVLSPTALDEVWLVHREEPTFEELEVEIPDGT